VPNVQPEATNSAPAPAAGDVRAINGQATPAAETGPPRRPEIGGPSGPEPTRYGDWERKGRCVDF